MKKLVKFFDFGGSFFGVILGGIVYFILITIAACLIIAAITSLAYVLFLDSSIFISTIHIFNPAEHLSLRVMGLFAFVVAFGSYYHRDEI